MAVDVFIQRCLRDLLAGCGLERSDLIHQLIRERWQERQVTPTISEQLGGPPPAFLSTLPPGAPSGKHGG